MIKTVVMPKLGTTMREGTLSEWHKEVGDFVEAGDVLLAVESNKATVDVEAVNTGYLVKIMCEPGETRPINDVIALLADSMDEDLSEFLATKGPQANQAVSAAASTAPMASAPQATSPSVGAAAAEGKIKAQPKARALAKKMGVDLSKVVGTGKDGMITVEDVERGEQATASASPLAKSVAAKNGVDLSTVCGTGAHGKIMKDDVLNTRPSCAAVVAATEMAAGDGRKPMSSMRKIIAENMYNSLHSMAQACHKLSIDMFNVKKIREAYAADGLKVSFNDIIAKAVSQALVENPNINASMDGNDIIYHANVNIGIAVALDEGLIVPNIKGAQKMTIPEIAAASKDLIQRTKSGSLTTSDYKGGTFTITNLGMFDIEDFVAVINPPEAGILALGKIIDTPVVMNGEIVIRPIMKVCLTYNHMLIDGAPAASFLKRVKELLENPIQLLIHG